MKILIASLLSFLVSANHAYDIASYVVSILYKPQNSAEYNLICSAAFLDPSFLISSYREVYRMKSLALPGMNTIPGYKVVVGVIGDPSVKIETKIENVYLAETGPLNDMVFGIIKLENPINLPGLNDIEWAPLEDENSIGRAQVLPNIHEYKRSIENFVQLEDTKIDTKALSIWYPSFVNEAAYSMSVTPYGYNKSKYTCVMGAPVFIGNKLMGFYTGTVNWESVASSDPSSSEVTPKYKYNAMDRLRNKIKCLPLPVDKMSNTFKRMLEID